MTSTVEELLADLIAIPSVNPMGGEADEHSFEQRVTDYLEKRFQRLGVDYRRQEALPDRDNIVAWISASADKGGESAPRVVWEAHQDTVPVAGMTVPPFTPEIRDGRMYGRGACDVKGPLAAMLAVFEQLARRESVPATIIFALSVNEEFGGDGASRLAQLWNEQAAFPFERPPDAVIVAEPTELQVVAAHKGTVRWRVRAEGKAAHSSTPQLGENAIYRMAHAVAALERYAAEMPDRFPAHPQLGSPTLSVGLIHGGASVNIVPESCWIEIDRRLVPGETPEQAWLDVAAFLKEESCQVTCEEPYLQSNPLPDSHNGDVVRRIIEAAERCGVASAATTAAYCSDAARLAHFPTVVFGPGDIAQAHTCDEWIELQQLAAAERILLQLTEGFDGASP